MTSLTNFQKFHISHFQQLKCNIYYFSIFEKVPIYRHYLDSRVRSVFIKIIFCRYTSFYQGEIRIGGKKWTIGCFQKFWQKSNQICRNSVKRYFLKVKSRIIYAGQKMYFLALIRDSHSLVKIFAKIRNERFSISK